jgi:hypothetical protein
MPEYKLSAGQDVTNRFTFDFDVTGYFFFATLKPDLDMDDDDPACFVVDHEATEAEGLAKVVDITFVGAQLATALGKYYFDCRITDPDGGSVANIPPTGPDEYIFVRSSTKRYTES